MSEAMLRNAFQAVGKEHGYDDVSADFESFKEFKVKWRRSCGWIEFAASDYMKDAPEEVLKGIAETIFSRITKRERRKYSDIMLEWLTSKEFVRNKQPIYLKRSRNLTGTHVGEHIDLNESYQRLIDMGLVSYDEDLVISWTRQPNVKRVGYCSTLMKVIAISSVFDTKEIPQFVSDFILYHEIIHLNKGFDPFNQKHDTDFRELERLYPRREEAEGWLKRLRLYL